MGRKYLGEHFDIHGGGMDLIFPHHECEIAQSVASQGDDMVHYWMHNNMITINGTKMCIRDSPEAMSKMSESERQAIHIASYYTEKHLMRVYSREKTVSRFLHKLSEDPERIKNDIRPSIEKKLLEMLILIRDNGLPFYQKQAGSRCV